MNAPTAPAAPRRRARAWAWAAAALAALLLATAAFLGWVVKTEAGNRWALERVPGLSTEGLRGSLFGGPFEAARLQWEGSGWRIVVDGLTWRDATWRWRPSPGAWVGLALDAPQAGRVVATRVQPAAPSQPAGPPASLRLPVELSLQALGIALLQIDDQPPVSDIAADVHLGADRGARHCVARMALTRGDLAVRGDASIGTDGDLPLQATVSVAGGAGTARPWQAGATLAGPLRRIVADATLRMPPAAQAQTQARAVLAPFAPFPLAALDLSTRDLDLSALGAALPQTRLSARAVLREPDATGGAATPLAFDVQVDNALPGPWDAQRLPLRHAQVLLRAQADDPSTLAFDTLQADLGDPRGGGRVTGTGQWAAGTLTLDLRIAGLEPARLHTAAPPLRLDGTVAGTVRGLPMPGPVAPGAPGQPGGLDADLRVALQGAIAARGAQRVVLDANLAFALPGDGSARLTVDALRAASGSARASGRAEGQRAADGNWRLATSGDLARFDPGVWWPRATAGAGRSALDGHWQADLRGAAVPSLETLRGDADITLAPSRYAGVAAEGKATLRAGDNGLRVQADLRVAGNRAQLDGNAGVAGRIPRWHVAIAAPALGGLAPLAALMPGAADWLPRAGAVHAQADIDGRWPALSTRGTLRAVGVETSVLRIGSADARWTVGGTAADAPVSVAIDAVDIAQQGRRLDMLQVRVDGTQRAHRLSLRAESPLRPPAWTDTLGAGAGAGAGPAGSALALTLDGSWQPVPRGGGAWQAVLQTLSAAPLGRAGAPWLAARDLAIAVDLGADGSLRSATLAPGRLDAFGGGMRWRAASWQAGPAGGAGRLTLDADVEPFRVAPLLAQWQPAFAWQGDLTLGAQVRIDAGAAFDADVVVTRDRGDLSLSVDGVRRPLGLDQLRLALAAHGGQWQLTQAMSGARLGVLAGGITARTSPGARWPEARARVDGGVSLRIEDLGVWAPWLPAGWRLAGAVRAVASIDGTAGDPRLRGRVEGTGLQVRNLFEGVNLRDGELAVALSGREAVIERAVFRGGGDGTLRATGRGTLDGGEPSAAVRIDADRFRVLDRVDRRIAVSGGADIALRGPALRVDGRFRVDQGLVDVSQADAPKNDPDVIVLNRPSTQPVQPVQPAQVAGPGAVQGAEVRLVVDLGQDLRLRGRGLDTRLRGVLQVTSTPGGPLRVAGDVRTFEGTYAAYGQNLEIRRGELSFSGDVANPRLDVLAVRPDLDTQQVGVVVSGQVANPRVRLYSEPALPEFDTLTWLVLGREPGGLGRDDTALLQRAALALLAGDRGGGPGKGFAQRLGLDELSFSAGGGDSLGAAVVSLGKQVSRRLYVGYQRALSTAGGTWQLIYRAAGRFTVRLQAGDDQALDVIWTWRWE